MKEERISIFQGSRFGKLFWTMKSFGKMKIKSGAIVVHSMWETALDMNNRYKETSEGGLAVNIPISLSEC